jgi:hypothetical protein
LDRDQGNETQHQGLWAFAPSEEAKKRSDGQAPPLIREIPKTFFGSTSYPVFAPIMI